MLQKIDKFIIAHQHKKHNQPFIKFANSKWGYILTTIFVLDRTITEIDEARIEKDYILMGIFCIAAALMFIYALKYLLWKNKIEKFEYRMKIFEGIILLYAGYLKGVHMYHLGANPGRMILYSVCIAILFLAYCFQARLFYLRYIGKIQH